MICKKSGTKMCRSYASTLEEKPYYYCPLIGCKNKIEILINKKISPYVKGCPYCGSSNISGTLIGVITEKDPNNYKCHDCGASGKFGRVIRKE